MISFAMENRRLHNLRRWIDDCNITPSMECKSKMAMKEKEKEKKKMWLAKEQHRTRWEPSASCFGEAKKDTSVSLWAPKPIPRKPDHSQRKKRARAQPTNRRTHHPHQYHISSQESSTADANEKESDAGLGTVVMRALLSESSNRRVTPSVKTKKTPTTVQKAPRKKSLQERKSQTTESNLLLQSNKQVCNTHGFLSNQHAKSLAKSTNYTIRELYILFARFKALCALSSTPDGIDKETFRNGVPMLSVEDNLFVDRVFEVLDEDGSGIIDWHEFIEAMSALEKGSREKRTEFLFRVYDTDKDGGITKDELRQFFISSLMVEVDDSIQEVSEYFVDQVFSQVDLNGDGSMTVGEALEFIALHPEVTDIYGMFGRSMMTEEDETRRVDFLDHGKSSANQQHALPHLLNRTLRREKTKLGLH